MRQHYWAISLVLILLVATGANATFINDPWSPGQSEQNVYMIYNSLFGTSYTNSNDIPRFSPDELFYASSMQPQATVILSQAGLTQNFGWYQVDGSGNLQMNYVFSVPPTAPGTTVNMWAPGSVTGAIGFYDDLSDQGGGTWYSEMFRNSDQMDHMVALMTPAEFGDTILLVFEDRSWSGDQDYNDLIIAVHGVVPEPTSLALLGGGLAMMGFRRRRKTV